MKSEVNLSDHYRRDVIVTLYRFSKFSNDKPFKDSYVRCHNPKRLRSIAVKRLLDRALWELGIRHVLPEGVKRHEWKGAHGYRKFYNSRAEQVMRPINVEITMGHDLGVSESYWRPTEREVLEES